MRNRRNTTPLKKLTAAQIAGVELRAKREYLGWSQRELAEKAGTTQTSVALAESGNSNPTIGLLGRMADAMGYDFKVKLRRS